MENIDIDQAQQRFRELIEMTTGGNEIIITRKGRPIAKISAIAHTKKRRHFGTAKGLIKMADDFDAPLEDFKGYT